MSIQNFLKRNQEKIITSGLIVVSSAICYLLLANQFGFYKDDWYLLYSGLTQGAQKYSEVFAIDRPFRAHLVGFMFNLFGANASLYSYSAYLMRVISAISFYWLIRLIWPNQKLAASIIAVLFVVYPGFLDQPNAFDYQSHIFSFTLAMISITLTIKAIKSPDVKVRICLSIISIFLAGIYLLLMEYYIGLEGFRFILIYYVTRSDGLNSFRTRILRAIKKWLPFSLSPLVFIIWRMFIFNSQRYATNIGDMFASITSSPIHRGLWFLVNLFQDLLNVVFFSWIVPAYQIAFQLRLRDTLFMLLFAFIGSVVVFVGFYRLRILTSNDSSMDRTNWRSDLVWLGLLAVILSLIPIIFGNRQVAFDNYSRFTLPGSAGAAMILVGLIFHISNKKIYIWIPTFFIALALMIHYANARNYVDEWIDIKNFWWQVSWRAPQIESGTVLAVDYARAGIPEDYLVWGPANLIYYSEFAPVTPTYLDLSAVILNKGNSLSIIEERYLGTHERRGIYSELDLSKTLVMSMPTRGSCVHIIDGDHIELSEGESEEVHIIAASSKINRILIEEKPHIPDTTIFGKEPVHNWCYYYEKASLARQRGNWEEIIILGEEVQRQRLHPIDWVEWMPFLQAYAYMGEIEKARALVPIIKEKHFLQFQACNLFSNDDVAERYMDGHLFLRDIFCQ